MKWVKKPICFQSHYPTCNDLILPHNTKLFKLSNTSHTVFSDYCKLVSAILKLGIFKGTSKIKIFRSCRKFNLKSCIVLYVLQRTQSEKTGEVSPMQLRFFFNLTF